MYPKYSDSWVKIKLERSPKDIITITSLGTKLKVISFIEVAACIIPMIRPTANPMASKGPAASIICQNAIRKNSTFWSNRFALFNLSSNRIGSY